MTSDDIRNVVLALVSAALFVGVIIKLAMLVFGST